MTRYLPVLLLAAFAAPSRLPLDKWTYIQVDAGRTRYDGRKAGGGGWFGIAAADLTGDGRKDIVAGKWFYRNPGGDMAGKWERVEIAPATDAIIATDVDGDEFGDIIAVRCNEQYWFEALDRQGNKWQSHRIGSLPVCNHKTGAQGYALAQIIAGGKPEILVTGDGIYYFTIPANPSAGEWPSVAIIEKDSNGEGLDAGDIDGDGDLDVAAVYKPDTADDAGKKAIIAWWENPNNGRGGWTRHVIGETTFPGDRFAVADLNGDRRMDVIVTEERWPGPDPDASLYWFEQPGKKSGSWTRHTVVTEYSLNNVDAADLDHDGDVDIVTCEHKGPKEKLQIWENDGRGNFREVRIDEGKESHLGARLADLDGDGDLDIISIAWDEFQYLHLWRNDARKRGS
jgi:hypothetical protein